MPMPSILPRLTDSDGLSTDRLAMAVASCAAPAENSSSFQTASFGLSHSIDSSALAPPTACIKALRPGVPITLEDSPRILIWQLFSPSAFAIATAPSLRIRLSLSCNLQIAFSTARAPARSVAPPSEISFIPRSKSATFHPSLTHCAMKVAPASLRLALWKVTAVSCSLTHEPDMRVAIIGGGMGAPRGSRPSPAGLPKGVLSHRKVLRAHAPSPFS
mmetsp:Transcript_44356/g.71315  ORF Transcript_44356/g.71315 Transcript_44356/m.71315 type:complete len:217 (+) Transcript_44356:854-1504(+)